MYHVSAQGIDECMIKVHKKARKKSIYSYTNLPTGL